MNFVITRRKGEGDRIGGWEICKALQGGDTLLDSWVLLLITMSHEILV
jgi:hypothetical protein